MHFIVVISYYVPPHNFHPYHRHHYHQWVAKSLVLHLYLSNVSAGHIRDLYCAHLIDRKMVGYGRDSHFFNCELFYDNLVNIFVKTAKCICQHYETYLSKSLLRALNWPKDGGQWPTQSSIQFLTWILLFRFVKNTKCIC